MLGTVCGRGPEGSCSSTTLIPWIVQMAAAASSLYLVEKVTTISLVLSVFNSRAIYHTTPQTHAALSCGDVILADLNQVMESGAVRSNL